LHYLERLQNPPIFQCIVCRIFTQQLCGWCRKMTTRFHHKNFYCYSFFTPVRLHALMACWLIKHGDNRNLPRLYEPLWCSVEMNRVGLSLTSNQDGDEQTRTENAETLSGPLIKVNTWPATQSSKLVSSSRFNNLLLAL